LTRPKATLIVLAVWAAIYLPGLGVIEYKGEEGRRMLPAAAMLDGGNWMVPSVGGEDYYKKPPGINWLVAASFAITGERTELTARLPSVAFMLAFAMLLLWMPTRWLSVSPRLLAALVFLTNVRMMEKGRLIEIEAVYGCITGLACYWWLNAWASKHSRWSLWVVPCVLLAAGALVKGPLLAVPFYATAVLVAWRSRRLRELLTVQHAAGIALILVLCLGWVYLARQQTVATEMTGQWSHELLERVIPDEIDYPLWGENILVAFANFLPWLLFVPLLWIGRFNAPVLAQRGGLFRGARLAMVISFAFFNLMPGSLSRYSLPVLPLASILLGWVLAEHTRPVPTDRLWRWAVLICLMGACVSAAGGMVVLTAGPMAWLALAAAVLVTATALWKWDRIVGGVRLSLMTAGVLAVCAMQYGVFGTLIQKHGDKRKPTGQLVSAIVPAGEDLYLYKPGYQGFVCYLRQPLKYLLSPEQIGEPVRYMVIAEALLTRPEVQARLAGRSPRIVYYFTDKIDGEFRLVRLDSPPAPAGAPTTGPATAPDR